MSLRSNGIVRRKDCRRRPPPRQHSAAGWCEATARRRLLVVLLLLAAAIATMMGRVDAFVAATRIGPSASSGGKFTARATPPPSTTSRRYAAALAGSDSDGGRNNVIVSLSAHAVKVGALRFLLQLYLVGQQNRPIPNSWLTRGNDEDDGGLDVYYGDGTAALHIHLDESGIEFARRGEKPSLQYVLQESVLLHGILDEIENAALGTGGSDNESIDDSKRLLRLSDPNDIDEARSKLPARKAS